MKAANNLGFVSHDHLTRQLSKEWTFTPVVDWEALPKEGRVVLDDSTIAKPHSETIEGVKWVWDSSQNKSVPGINLLLALWVVGNEIFVLDVIFPQDENRNDLTQDLLRRVSEAGFKPTEVSFDAWYAASKTLNLIHTLGWTYVCRMRSNRIFNGQAIEMHSFHGAQGRIGKLRGVYAQVQIVKHGDRYLVTNELTPHTSRTAGVFEAIPLPQLPPGSHSTGPCVTPVYILCCAVSVYTFTIPILGAAIFTLAFYILDVGVYHTLLKGAVICGQKFERKYLSCVLPSNSIEDHSKKDRTFGFIRGAFNKISWFYGIIGISLLILFFILNSSVALAPR